MSSESRKIISIKAEYVQKVLQAYFFKNFSEEQQINYTHNLRKLESMPGLCPI